MHIFNPDGSYKGFFVIEYYVHYQGMFAVRNDGEIFCWEDLGNGFEWCEPFEDAPNLNKVKAAALLLKK